MHKCFYFPWAQLGLNQRPPDYELGKFLLYLPFLTYLFPVSDWCPILCIFNDKNGIFVINVNA